MHYKAEKTGKFQRGQTPEEYLYQNPWSHSSEEVANSLNVHSDKGLSDEEVKKRQNIYGYNKLREHKRKSLLAILWDQLKSLIVLLLVVAAIVSFLYHEMLEGWAIIAVIVINTAIGFFTEVSALRSMEALLKMGKVKTRVRRDGEIKEVDAVELVPGDIVIVEAGDIITADIRITESSKLQANESALTGESMPVGKQTDAVDEDTILAERRNMLYKGTAVTRGSGEGVVVSTGLKTELGGISSLVEEAESEQTPLEKRLAKLGYRLIGLTLLIAVFVTISGIVSGKEIYLMIEVGIALAVAAIPEGLPVVATIALARGMKLMADKNALINRLSSVETLGTTGIIFSDKTGTLTKADRAEIIFQGEDLSEQELKMVDAVCRQSLHPLSRKIASHLSMRNGVAVQHFEEVLNQGIRAKADDINLLVGSASFLETHLSSGFNQMKNEDKNGSTSTVHVAIDGQWKGVFEISNRYRSGIRELLGRFKERFSTYLISGDNESQKHEFVPYFKDSALRFNQTPRQKLKFIKELQKDGGSVVMIGDGLNDAGALQQSDFGIALADDVNAFTPACDAILDGKALHRMDTFIDFSRASITVIKLSFGLSLLYNVVGLGFAVAGLLSPLVAAILMPLSSISIMIFTTAGTHLAAKKWGLISWK